MGKKNYCGLLANEDFNIYDRNLTFLFRFFENYCFFFGKIRTEKHTDERKQEDSPHC